MKVLFATTNPAKIKNYKEILKSYGIELLTLKDISLDLKVEETGNNAIENAYLKAKAYFDATGMPTIGMDNNLFIEELPDDQQPGCYVRRVGGKELTDDEMIEHYTSLVRNNGGRLTATWVYGMVFINEKGVYEHSWSYDHFYLVDTPNEKRNPGYPLDSISIDTHFNKYFVELNEEEKEKKKSNRPTDGVIEFILSSLDEKKKL